MTLSGGSANRSPAGDAADPAVDAPREIVPPAIDAVLCSAPFLGRTRLCRTANTITGVAFDFVVAVPVHNEADFVSRCLESLVPAFDGAGMRGAIVLVVHDSTDRSFDLIADFLATSFLEGLVVELSLDAGIRNAPHARRFALDLAVRLCPKGVLLTTDADTRVAANWCRDMLTPIKAGYDLVCEDIRLEEDELARLPGQVCRIGEAERALFDASNVLWLRWTGGQHGIFAHRPSGASMAFRSALYSGIGGLPLPAAGEDMALCDAALAAGGRVLTLPDCGTRTSARIAGRAAGGCGAALKERSQEGDPYCDVRLMPIDELRSLAALAAGMPAPYGQAATVRSQPLRYSEVLVELEQARRLLD